MTSAKIQEVAKGKNCDVNYIHNGNTALTVALNRFLGAEVVSQLTNLGAKVNFRTQQGTLVSELLFQQD